MRAAGGWNSEEQKRWQFAIRAREFVPEKKKAHPVSQVGLLTQTPNVRNLLAL
jgi:hypothetical protein